jgi:hypothetical protein
MYILLATILVPATKYDDFNSREHMLGGRGGGITKLHSLHDPRGYGSLMIGQEKGKGRLILWH